MVPSITELLFELGLNTEVVGITKFCIRPPEWHSSKTRIGGTKEVDLDKLLLLRPNLVIANREENVRQEVEIIAQHVPVWLTDVSTTEEALNMISDIGNICHKKLKAATLIAGINQQLAQLKRKHFEPIPVAYLIWRKPYMTVGGDTYINDLLIKAGFVNVYNSECRYPITDQEGLKKSGAKLVLLSSEPYPFKTQHQLELETILPGIPSLLVDGEMFSWYGSRLKHFANYAINLRSSLKCRER